MYKKVKIEAVSLINNIIIKSKHVLSETKAVLKDESDQQLVDNGGWIALIVVLIGVVMYASYPWLKDTLWPAVTSKIMNLLNYSGS